MSDSKSGQPITADELMAADKAAVPARGLAMSPSGDVLVIGRHPLGIEDVAVRVNPADVVSVAAQVASLALEAVRKGKLTVNPSRGSNNGQR